MSGCASCNQVNCAFTITVCTCPCHVREAFSEPEVRFYAIRNSNGDWYRTYARNRSAGWVSELVEARVYTRLGPAQAKVTVLSRGGMSPDLVEFVVTKTNVISQEARLEKARKKRLEETARKEAYTRKWLLERAQAEFDKAQQKLKKLQGEG